MTAMDLVSIGEAADLLGLKPSTLRYYEERGLIQPAQRQSGRRMYGPDELRRLAFLHLVHRLDVPLATAGEILDAPGEQWREGVKDQIAELEDLIIRARGAQAFLQHALACPREHPMSDCPKMRSALDDMVAGKTFGQLAAEHS